MHIGVISFPGSGGDHDALSSLDADLRATVRRVDYRETSLSGLDAVVLPGGFSWGDALRPGAIARFSPVMTELRRVADDGMPILGIGNGFQILCEAHMLPGALLQNASLRFQASWLHIRIEQSASAWTSALSGGDVLRLPIAHGYGAYYVESGRLKELEAGGQIVARYCTREGEVTEDANPNGSVGNVAAVSNERGNVVGMMPHPERATNALVGGTDGLRLLKSISDTATVG